MGDRKNGRDTAMAKKEEGKEVKEGKVHSLGLVGTAEDHTTQQIAQKEPPRASRKFVLCPFSYRECRGWQDKATLGRTPPVV